MKLESSTRNTIDTFQVTETRTGEKNEASRSHHSPYYPISLIAVRKAKTIAWRGRPRWRASNMRAILQGGKGRNNFHNRERSTSRRKDNNVGQTVNRRTSYQSPTINLDLDGRLRK